ncbi:MAG: biotin--[acetyl-CoA-carboxylase] ligase, partial [Rhodospirillaceae bacterium]
MSGPRLPTVYNLVAHDSVGSTNDVARELARKGEDAAPDGTLVWASEQTAGRGRRGRTWVSPPGNLYLSLILRPEMPAAEA